MSELFSAKTPYHRIRVDDDEPGLISLRFNGCRQSSMSVASGHGDKQIILNYLHLFLALVPDSRSVLCIGLGGGMLPKRILSDYPEINVTAVELDPVVVEIAKRFFGVEETDKLRIVTGDGRAFVDCSTECWDAIIVDAYFESSVPYALVTREFVHSCSKRLSPEGVLSYNMVGVLEGEGNGVFASFLATLRDVFPAVYLFPVGNDCGGGRQNIFVAACKRALDIDEIRKQVRSCVGGRVKIKGFSCFADNMIDCTKICAVAQLLVDAMAPENGLLSFL